VRIYGKTVTLTASVGLLIPSRRLGNAPLRVVSFPRRSGHKMNIFFSTEPKMTPERLLEL
jgi:Transposase DDE domain